MEDLNDLNYFAQAVEHGGFAPAGRALGMPKSKLSRRIALLEERLGVRLVHRTTRQFTVTEVGQTFYEHCKAMLVEAEAAQDAIVALRSEPTGTVRLTCPVALLHVNVGDILAGFMAANPKVQVQLEASNRRVDLVAEGIDVAIRVRPLPLEDSELIVRQLADRAICLAASPALVERMGMPSAPAALTGWPSLGLGQPQQTHSWELFGPGGAQATVFHQPRFITTDMIALRNAAVAGVGVVQLPLLMVKEQLATGALVRLLPDWAPRREVIHAVYPSRRGMLPSVRALLDYLAERYAAISEE